MHRAALENTFKEWLGDNFDALLDRYEILVEHAVLAEREACAKIAEEAAKNWAGEHGRSVAYSIAAAIRARGAT